MEALRAKVGKLLRSTNRDAPPECQRRDSGLNGAAASSSEPPPPSPFARASGQARPGKPPVTPVSPLKLMTLTTISLSVTCLCSTIVQSQLLHEGALRGRYDAGNDDAVSFYAGGGGGGGGGTGTASPGLDLLGPKDPDDATAAALPTNAAGGGGASEAGDIDAGGGGGSGGGGGGAENGVGGGERSTEGFGVQSQEEFLIAVKRRLKIQTPLDNTFWRPYARLSAEGRATIPEGENRTNLIFVAGAEGTGHHFVSVNQRGAS
jgi:hypothetical protein